jgi:hypothetical protein
MLISCEECNYYVGNKCWHYGKMNLGQQWEKIVRNYEKDRSSINEILKPETVKEDPVWQELLEIHEHHVQRLQERKRAIAIQLKDVLASDFWEVQGIERPILEQIIEPDRVIGKKECIGTV